MLHFYYWHFTPIFIHLKLTCLVALFGSKLTIINLFFKFRKSTRIIRCDCQFSLIVDKFFDQSQFILQLLEVQLREVQLLEVMNKFVEDWKLFFFLPCNHGFQTLRNGFSLINKLVLGNFQFTLDKSITGFAHFLDTHSNQ